MTPLKVRYVLVSDYATVDHAGKLVIAGLYTEDMVVPALPAMFSTLVITILTETPTESVSFRFTVEAPSGAVAAGGGGKLDPSENLQGTRPRAIVGFQFNSIVFTEGGEYKLVVSDMDGPDRHVIHQFRVVVDPNARPDNVVV
ncbi:DUF6941 family protein [Bradyrhizobium sp. 1(2017)]|uniref:DUF6941 family protein n=1 Tax=Bradyrhizobium sp. 1(2017) TaxID=1404888 RepID=UPI00140ED52F|nr:hypothetical protein [Bradyrhizobium sp. 1(2017)]QIO34656.1 hypothetical protein HAP40_24030 [Bradyrhizobium sp. 1(2017)]